MRATGLTIHPVKSTRGRSVQAATVEPWGLAGDRRGMVVRRREAGWEKLTARTHRKLLAVDAELAEHADALTVSGPHADALRIPLSPAGERITVALPRAEVTTVAAGRRADAWFSDLLGEPVRLVWLADPAQRPVNPRYGNISDRVGLADGYPLLLASTESLDQLNEWITAEALDRGESRPPAPLVMRRFRPNVTVTGAAPFAEDGWRRIRIGGVDFRVAKPCDRCVLPTVDPDTLSGGKEPLRTLARHRRWDGHVWFGMHLIPDGVGVIRVGDEVEILEEAPLKRSPV